MGRSTALTGTTATAVGSPGVAPPGLLVLERYRLQRPLGSGGFGSVWQARDERLGRDVAIKLLARERVVGGRFEREARAAARLSHPGIVTLYEAAVDDDGAYLVSELVRGATLAERLETGELSDGDVLAIGIALCDALEHAHEQGVVHRDVKPSNILVPEQPPSLAAVAKLTDFGVARLVGADTLTRTGDVVGTAAYMAPEQADGREAGSAADVYSLALVLYEALSGINPVRTGTGARRARRLGAHLPPLRRQRRELPPALTAAIDIALAPDPHSRGSVAELREGLVHGLGVVDDRPGVVEAPWPTRRVNALARKESSEEAPDPAADPAEPRPRLSVAGRILAGIAAGLAVAWIVARLLGPVPFTPAAAGILAGLLVAALPRLGWTVLNLVAAAILVANGRPGAAMLVGIAVLLPIVLLPRSPTRWPLAVGGPLLGAVALAGGWPALAGRDRGAWRRAVLGAAGWVWTVTASLLVGRGAYGIAAGMPPRSDWTASVGQTAGHVLPVLLGAGVVGPAAVWGAAAVALPWVAGDRGGFRTVGVLAWATALTAATAAAVASAPGARPLSIGTVALWAATAGILALAPKLPGRRARAGSPDTPAGLA